MKDNVTLGRMASVWQLSVTNDECVTYSAVVDVHDIIDMCRYQMFLQLKLDVLSGRLPCSDDTAAELSALVLQCTLVLYLTLTSQ